MKQVVTKQGKTFYYRDVLLFNVVNDNIVLIVDDTEQIDKYSLTKNSKDAPIAVIPYSEETLKEVVAGKKKIDTYTELNENKILVEFSHPQLRYPTKVAFDGSNKEIIENNLIEQRKFSDNNSVGNWYDSDIDTESGVLTYEESNVDSVEQARRFKIKKIEQYDKEIKVWKGTQTMISITLGLIAAVTLYGIEKINFISYDHLGVFMTQVGVTSGLMLNNMAKVISRKTTYQVLKEELEHELAEELVEEKSRGAK